MGRSAKKRLVIEIKNKKILFCVGSFDDTDVYVEKVFKKQLDFEVFKDGKLIDEKKIANIIKETLKEKGIKVKKCYLYIAESEIIKKTIVVPFLASKSDFHNLIISELSQALPIDLDEFVVKYKIASETKTANNANIKLDCSLLNRESVYAYKNVLKLAGLNPQVLDMCSSALDNLVKFVIMYNSGNTALYKKEIEDTSIAFVEMGTTNCSVSIFKGGKLDFSRVVKLPFMEEDVLKEFNEITYINEIKNEETFEAINEILSEINLVIKYYINRDRTNKIDEIFLYGESSKIKEFDKYMQDILLNTVNSIDMIEGIKMANGKTQEVAEYVSVIGGLIRW